MAIKTFFRTIQNLLKYAKIRNALHLGSGPAQCQPMLPARLPGVDIAPHTPADTRLNIDI
jgi:hypothetical protein